MFDEDEGDLIPLEVVADAVDSLCKERDVEHPSQSDDAGEASAEPPKIEKTVRDSGENVRVWG